jgi:GAF domain-containing protein
VLTIVAQRGFGPGFLEHFRTVGGDDTSACGRALRSCAPIAVVDVQQDPAFHGHREVMEIAGVRAVKSLPIVASDGRVLGMLSTHFRQPQPIDVSTIREFADRAAALIQDGDNGNAAGSRSR